MRALPCVLQRVVELTLITFQVAQTGAQRFHKYPRVVSKKGVVAMLHPRIRSHRKRRGRQVRRPLFGLEHLEARVLLTSRTWNGGGSDNKWTTAANWVGGVAPAA